MRYHHQAQSKPLSEAGRLEANPPHLPQVSPLMQQAKRIASKMAAQRRVADRETKRRRILGDEG